MSKIKAYVRFSGLSMNAKGEEVGSDQQEKVFVQEIKQIDDETFLVKDDDKVGVKGRFDRVFYEDSTESDVFEFMALPILHDAVNGINGTIITYGQGLGVLHCNEDKGLITRVVEWLSASTTPSSGVNACSVSFSMVEIYMEKIRDLFDLSKDNLQIKESKAQGILLNGVTEIPLLDAAEALDSISNRIARSGSRMCIFRVQSIDRSGTLVIVDLEGSKEVEQMSAKVMEAQGGEMTLLYCCTPYRATFEDVASSLQVAESLVEASRAEEVVPSLRVSGSMVQPIDLRRPFRVNGKKSNFVDWSTDA